MRAAVAGGMNLDVLGAPDACLRPRDSAPGKIILRAGGVGRNIAARLRGLGVEAFLITALGNDDRAALLARLCGRDGIDLSLALETDLPAPCYLCIHDEQGDMALAVNDMSAMDRLTPGAMAARMQAVNEADLCVLDANLPEETLAYIAQNASVPLLLDPVSCFKAPRARGILPRLAAIKPNRLEAEALTGERNVERAGDALLRAGVRAVFISLGPEGVYYCGSRERGYLSARPLPSLPLTGAGDALCAGLALGMMRGLSLRECARTAQETAYQALLANNCA